MGCFDAILTSVMIDTEQIKELKAEIDWLKSDRDDNKIPYPTGIKLTRKEFRLYQALMSADLLTHKEAFTYIYGDRYYSDGELPDMPILHVFLHRLRRKLEPFNIFIENQFGVGWRIPEASKKLALSL